MAKFSFSKNTKIISITILLTVLSLLLTYLLTNEIQIRINNNLINHYSDVEQEITKEVSLILQSDVYSLQDQLVALSQISEIKNGNTDTCNKKLDKVFSQLQYKISNIARIGSDKRYKCSVNRAFVGIDATKFGSYVNQIFNDPMHNPVLSRNVINPSLSSNAVGFHVATYDDQGNFNGTIGAAIYFDQLKEKFLKDIKLTQNGYTFILDDDGTILYSPNKKLIGLNYKNENAQELTGQSNKFYDAIDIAKLGNQSSSRYFVGKQERVATHIPIQMVPGHLWIVSATVPIQDIEDSVSTVIVKNYFKSLFYLLFLCIMLPPILLITYLIFGIFKPIKRIIISMRKVSEGNFDEKIKYESTSPNDEIFQLLSAFTTMETKLKESYSMLEAKVSQRTSQLEDSKNSLEILVKERTKELEDAKQNLEKDVINRTSQLNEELVQVEKINNLTIGRELTMINLKNKIQKLEEKLQKHEKQKKDI